MGVLDNLPADQRAVLQMVLQRGRSYDEIAGVLSIERDAVRQRALDAFAALTPSTVVPGPESALVTDYLLGQLPERVASEVHTFLRASEADRVWAQVLADTVAPLAGRALPEVPVGAPLGADPGEAAPWERIGAPAESRSAEPEPEAESPAPSPEPEAQAAPSWDMPATPREHRPGSSRRGGRLLLATVAVVIVAAVIVGVVFGSGSNSTSPASTTVAQTQTGSTTTETGRTSTASTTAQTLAQLNLTSPTGAGSVVGVALVIREAGTIGIVVDAQGVPANTTHNAYGVWLYNSSTSHEFVGFVPSLVGKNGKLTTEGKLPADATRYGQLLVTLETQSKPTTPGEVVLQGPFREHA